LIRLSRDAVPAARYIGRTTLVADRGKYRRSSIENDYCGDKPGLSPLPLILPLTLTLNPNPKDLTNPNHTYPNRPTTNPSLPPQQWSDVWSLGVSSFTNV